MLIDKSLIIEAKNILGEEAAEIIQKELDIQNWENKNLRGCCPFHNENTPSFIFNPKENSFKCFGCGKVYGIIDHYMFHDNLTYLESVEKLFAKTNIKFHFGERGVKTEKDYKYPHFEHSEDRSIVEEYAKTRCISKETLDWCNIQQDEKGNMMFPYYDTNDVLCLVKYRPAKKVEKSENKMWCQKGSDTTPLLFNMNKTDFTNGPLIITEGECFPGNTEILTPQGWIELKNYNGELVLQVDDNMNASFVMPYAYIKKHYIGNMINYKKGGNFSLTITENHNVVYFDHKKRLKKVPANKMPKSIGKGYIPTVVYMNGIGLNLSNDQIALYLAVSADCTIDVRESTGNRHCRFGVKKYRKFLRMKNLLENLNIEYFENANVKGGYKYIGFKTPEWIKSKSLPIEWVSQTNLEQKNFILNEMVFWDGNRVSNRNQVEYSSKIYENALFMQTIAHTCGIMSTIMKRKNSIGEWYKVSILFNKKSVSLQKGFDSITDFEGEVYCVNVPSGIILIRQENHISVCGNCDTLSIIESGYVNCVSVPFGSNNFAWIEKSWDFLEKFDNIIIWSDNDSQGIAMRKEAVFRLGVWRCRFIALPNEIIKKDGSKVKIKDANELLYYTDKATVLDYIDNAQEMPVVGVDNLADIPDFDIETALGLYTGLAGIDKVVYKFLLGSVLVVTGKKGAGKSTLINQCFVCEPLHQGYDVFIYSGELDPGILKSWIELTMAGPVHTKMKGDFIHVIDKETKTQMAQWYDKRIWLYTQKSNKIQDILDRGIAITRKYGSKVWVIDNLTTIDLETNSSELLEKQKSLINRLNDLSITYGILIVLICHPRKVMAGQDLVSDDVGGNGALTNLAPYVASVKRYEEKDKKGEKGANGKWKAGKEPVLEDVEIDIMKNRFTGKVGKTRLYFNYKSYRFFNSREELFKKYNWDKSNAPVPRLEDEDERFSNPDFMK